MDKGSENLGRGVVRPGHADGLCRLSIEASAFLCSDGTDGCKATHEGCDRIEYVGRTTRWPDPCVMSFVFCRLHTIQRCRGEVEQQEGCEPIDYYRKQCNSCSSTNRIGGMVTEAEALDDCAKRHHTSVRNLTLGPALSQWCIPDAWQPWLPQRWVNGRFCQ